MSIMVPSKTPALITSGHQALDSALHQLGQTADRLGLDDGLRAMLATPRRSMTVSVPVRREDGRLDVVQGFHVQHNVSRGPAKVGLRFHPGTDLHETTALAMWMTWKCALAGIPYGGAEGGVAVDPAGLTARELERLTRRYVNEILPLIGPEKDVPVAGLGTDERTMAWVRDAYNLNTGYPASAQDGASPHADATARGVQIAVLAALGRAPAGTTVAVQGFGKVGAPLAQHLADAGCKVVAVSDASGAVHAGGGLDIARLRAWAAESGGVAGYRHADALPRDELFELDVDVLVPAALQGAIGEANAPRVRARLVVEGADGPITPRADEILHAGGTTVVPDILAGAGGVIVSHLEWVQSTQACSWSPAEVELKLSDLMRGAFSDVTALAAERGLTLRQAAHVIAVGRVAEAHQMRGPRH